MSGILDYANAVASALSEYGAEVALAPDFDIRDLKGIRVVVLPYGRKAKLATRISHQNQFVINVAIIQKANGMQAEENISKAEEIGAKLLGAKLVNGSCLQVEWDPLYSVDELREKGLFISVLKIAVEDFSRAQQ